MPIRTSNPKPDPGNPVGFWRPKTQVDRWARAEMVTRADTGGDSTTTLSVAYECRKKCDSFFIEK